MRELTAEDFKNAKRNPFFDKICRKVEVVITHEDYAVFEKVAKMNGETPEWVMKRCLASRAKEFQED